MYSEMKKNIVNRDAPTSSPDTFAPVRVRDLKMRNGTRGEAERSSIAVNAASSAVARGALREGVGEEGRRRGGREGGAEPLQGARRDQPGLTRGQAAHE